MPNYIETCLHIAVGWPDEAPIKLQRMNLDEVIIGKHRGMKAMNRERKMLTREKAEEEVRKIARLFGLMFYHFASLLVEELGKEGGLNSSRLNSSRKR